MYLEREVIYVQVIKLLIQDYDMNIKYDIKLLLQDYDMNI